MPPSRPYRSAAARLRARGAPGLLLLAVVLAAAVPYGARAQQLQLYATADTVSVGDRFEIVITARHDGRFSPLFLDSVQVGELAFGDFEVVRVGSAGFRLVNPGVSRMQVDSIVYEVTTFALDTAFVAGIPVAFTTRTEGDTVYAATPPLLVPVRSLVPEDASDVLDLKALADFPRPLWPYLLAALVALLATLAVYYFLRRRRGPRVDPPRPEVRMRPYDAALERLKTLEDVDLQEEVAVKPYYVDLSETLRTYLGDVLRLPAMEQTTRELVRDLKAKAGRHAGRVPKQVPGIVEGVLDLADLVKFADYVPRTEDGREALARTRESIDAVEAELTRWRAAEQAERERQAAERRRSEAESAAEAPAGS